MKTSQNYIYDHISIDGVSMVQEFEEFLKNPLGKYNNNSSDIYLEALGMAYRVNIITFQSDCTDCRILENINKDNSFEHTLYFVRTVSPHFDAVIPVSCKDIDSDSDSGESLVIIDTKDGSETVDMMTFRTPKTEPKDHAHSNSQVVEKNSSGQDQDNFDFSSPSAESLFQVLYVDPMKLEVKSPLV